MLKKIIQKFFNSFGYQISRSAPGQSAAVGTETATPLKKPLGDMDVVLEGLKNRGLVCSILDVGANSGVWSRKAGKYFPDSKFHLVEPQLEMIPFLDRYCASNPKVSYTLAGAGAENGKLLLTVWDDLPGSSFTPQKDESLLQKGKQREVDIVTIDSLVEKGKLNIPEMIKIDVQGFELEVLRGATSTFGKTEIYILEVSLFPFGGVFPVLHEVVDFMLQRGYTVYDIGGFNRRPVDGALAQMDICFAKRTGFLRASDAW